MRPRILIVEDDKHTSRILQTLLTKDPALARLDPEIVMAADGQEGLELARAQAFQLIVSDLLMPRVDGFTFCRELRKLEFGKKVPLIVTSAIYRDPTAVSRLREETQAEFFAKPFQMRELVAAVRRLLVTDATAKPLARVAVGAAPAPVERPQTQKGTFADRSPPRLLLDLAEEKATGMLSLTHGKVRKDVVLYHGAPVSVSSNLRVETLGHFLVGRGLLDDDQHQQALARAQQSHDRLGQVLIDLGWLSARDLLRELAAQMRAKLTSLLRWSDGTWMFTPGNPPPDRLQTPAEATRVVFRGLAKTARLDEIALALSRRRGHVALTLKAERHREPFVRVFGATGLDTFGRRPLVEDLLSASDPGPLLVQLDALLACAMADVEPARTQAQVPTDARPLERRLAEAEPAAAGAAPRKDLYDELFGEDVSEVRTSAPEPDGFDEDEPSSVANLAPEPFEPPEPPDPSVEALRRELLSAHLSLPGQDHYTVMGVPRDASSGQIADAYGALMRRFDLARYAAVDLGADYNHLEEIHHRLREAYETLTKRRQAYDLELSPPQPLQTLLEAELCAHRAEQKLEAGELPAAREAAAGAVRAAPDQADYHALLGWATFLEAALAQGARSAIQQARPHFEQALAIDPDQVDAHEFAGRAAAAAGDDERALTHLERALDLEPGRAEALTALEATVARRGDWQRLERQYRKLIHRGDSAPLRLWWRLAEIYRVHLGDLPAARAAYEMAAKLAPNDPRPRDALAALPQDDARGWDVAAQALRESVQLQPRVAEPAQKLLALHLSGQRWDAAFQVASVLVARGLDDAQASELYRRHRPRFLVRAHTTIDSVLVDLLRHPDDDRNLGALFGRLFARWRPALDLGLRDEDRVPPGAMAEPFRKVLEYAARAFEVPLADVYQQSDFGGDAHVGATEPPVLLAGPEALAMRDRLGLAFRLGRAMSYCIPGRAAAGGLPARQLKYALLGAVTLAQPALKLDDPDGQIAATRAQLAAQSGLARELGPLVEALLTNPLGSFNLSRYQRGLARTADRLGLLLAADLPTALRVVAESAALGAEDDLVGFALSPEYLEAREAMGLSVAV